MTKKKNRKHREAKTQLTFLQCSSKSILSLRQVVPGVLMFKSVVHRPSSDKCWGWYDCPASHSTAICGSQRGDAPCNIKKEENKYRKLNNKKRTILALRMIHKFTKFVWKINIMTKKEHVGTYKTFESYNIIYCICFRAYN